MNKIFTGKDNHLRAGWQIVLCFLTYFAANMVMQLILGLLINAFQIQITESVELLLYIVIELPTVLALIFVFTKINGCSVRVMGIDSVKNSWRQFIVGSLIGVISIAILAVISYLIGDYHVVQIGFMPIILIYFLYYIVVGISEEILCRGFLQQTILIRWGVVAAILFPSFLFASLHLANANFSLIAMINTALVGIIFGIFVIRYDNIAAAIGFHIFWNFFQGNIFGVSVSGKAEAASLIKVIRDKDTIWTGGAYGLEGGLLCSVVLLIIIVLQLRFMKQRPVNEEFKALTQKAEPRFPFLP